MWCFVLFLYLLNQAEKGTLNNTRPHIKQLTNEESASEAENCGGTNAEHVAIHLAHVKPVCFPVSLLLPTG